MWGIFSYVWIKSGSGFLTSYLIKVFFCSYLDVSSNLLDVNVWTIWTCKFINADFLVCWLFVVIYLVWWIVYWYVCSIISISVVRRIQWAILVEIFPLYGIIILFKNLQESSIWLLVTTVGLFMCSFILSIRFCSRFFRQLFSCSIFDMWEISWAILS